MRREIVEHLGLEKLQIKDWVRHYNHEQPKLGAGMTPRLTGRPSNGMLTRDAVAEQAYGKLARF